MVLVLLLNSPALAQQGDVDILKRSLAKALGERTNWRTDRIIKVTKGELSGRTTLLIALNANHNLTLAGLRYDALKDVTKVLGILKSWDWPGKVEEVVIIEQYPGSVGSSKGLGLKFALPSAKVRDIDWNSVDPKKIPEIIDVTEQHVMK